MGGKSSAPAAPDYIGQANTTAAGNLAAARSQTQANRINQITPYGSIKYTQGDGSFDQRGYDEALGRYQNQQEQIRNNAGLQEYYGKTGQLLTSPDRNQFVGGSPDSWSSSIELSDTGKQLLDADSRTRLRLAGLQDTAADRVAAMLGNTDLSESTGMDGWDKYSALLMSRLNPDLDAQQSALDTKLANQGLTAGSEGWGTAQTQFGKQRADANVAAQLAGAQVQKQFFDQSAYLRNLPINELNALRTGSAVTNPTFSTPGQQGQTSGPDLMGAANAGYTNALNDTNAKNAQSASTTAAGIGAVGAIAAAFF